MERTGHRGPSSPDGLPMLSLPPPVMEALPSPPKRDVSSEAHLALSQRGYDKLLRFFEKEDVKEKTREDLYVEAWDGENFLLRNNPTGQRKLRVKKGRNKNGRIEYELQFTRVTAKYDGPSGQALTTRRSEKIQLDEFTGRELVRLGNEIIDDIRQGTRVTDAQLEEFDAALRRTIKNSRFDAAEYLLHEVTSKPYWLVPGQANNKRRVRFTFKELGIELRSQLGKTWDWDPQTNEPRVRYELEVEPPDDLDVGDGADVMKSVERRFKLDELNPDHHAGEEPPSQQSILRVLNRTTSPTKTRTGSRAA